MQRYIFFIRNKLSKISSSNESYNLLLINKFEVQQMPKHLDFSQVHKAYRIFIIKFMIV